MRERLKVYQRQTKPLVEYYPGRPTFRSIDGNQPPDVVTGAIDAALDRDRRRARGVSAVIVCKSPAELERMRAANALVADVLARAGGDGGAGRDDARSSTPRPSGWCATAGAEPAFKGYRGYPATLCASVNEEVVHGIPSDARAGRGRHHLARHGREAERLLRRPRGDACRSGRCREEAATLLRVTRGSRSSKAIAQVRLGGRVSDIGHAVQQHVEAHGFSVVREFVGHGIGAALHEEPQVANYGEPGRGPRLAEGMVLAIEPMVNAGRPAVKVLADGWTAVTRDGSLSAHFEHTVAVTKDGPLVLTRARRAGAGARDAAPDDAGRSARTADGGGHGRRHRCSRRCRTGCIGSASSGSGR